MYSLAYLIFLFTIAIDCTAQNNIRNSAFDAQPPPLDRFLAGTQHRAGLPYILGACELRTYLQ